VIWGNVCVCVCRVCMCVCDAVARGLRGNKWTWLPAWWVGIEWTPFYSIKHHVLHIQ
jgi:hypothetical protein